MKTTDFREHFKRNYQLAYPVVLSQLGHVLVGTADSVMVGRVGTEELAAVSVANAVFSVAMMFGIGVSFGLTPLIAQSDGEGNQRAGMRFLKHSFVINVLFGILLFGILLFGGYILDILNQPKDVVALAKPYLAIVGFSLLPFMVFQTFKQFAEGLSLTKQAMYITLSANVINILLNYVLIFGKLGFEPMGLVGAGWATLISRIIMAVAMVLFVKYFKVFAVYWNYFKVTVWNSATFKRLLNLGVPTGFQYIFEVGAFASAAIMIGWMGAVPLASHQVAMNLASISYMMATGISAAATVRVGNQLGQRDIPTMRIAAFTCFLMAIFFMAFTGLVFMVFNHLLPTFYTSDPAVISIAASLLIIAALFQLSDGIQVVGLGALRGMGDVKLPTLVTFMAYWVIGLPCGYLLAFILDFGEQGVWYGLLIGLSVTAVILFIRFNNKSKKLMAELA
ncbi:MATE family efflux transporter [Marivirga tractuosa]|uniref:Multidrug-efflux transporter n=1 Tax=Marivirga tractuosa (strain ATCC 23168 / DSM 4126 / NBRC 15989 / NCIMB 1408 / VKM B-1430 / H-43) TaxID=643867 RepID=E4TVN4_MARTH|nr:MATE family efflux transporter [Marivirga tractuosa]ADR21147.1 MATE efflux family protein [Marivirga tractuosa DSM 4126]BDD14399.1 MATE family efflux transporter [Marivirga tractuosa]